MPATSHAPGVGRYARELVRALVTLDDRPDLALFDVGRAAREVETRLLGLTPGDPRARRVTSSLPRTVLAALARVMPLGADTWLGGVDLFHHVLHAGPPVARAAQSIALSELPPAGSPADKALRARLDSGALVFVFSRDYVGRVRTRYGVDPRRVAQTSVGCEHWRRELSALPARATPPLVLVLGSTRRERAPLVVWRAFEHAVREGLDAHIVFAGRRGEAQAELEAAIFVSEARGRVRFEHDLAERSLPKLVGSAAVLVHLSDDEGTPVTPLEALALDVPVVASRLPAFEEALGDAVDWVETAEAVREPARLSQALAHAIDHGRDAALAARRALVARSFTWERCAKTHAERWREFMRSRT